MPTTTWSQARVDILRPLGVVEAATTTNITTNTSVISTALADDYVVDDTFIGWYCMILNDADGSSSSNNGTVRRVTDYTASSGTLTVAGANLSAEDESVNVILCRFNPDHVKSWFNRTRQNVFPQLAIIRDHQPIVTGQVQRRFLLPSTLRDKPLTGSIGEWPAAASVSENLFTNGDFETWSSTTSPGTWSNTSHTSITQEQETTGPSNYGVFRDSNSAKCLGAASTECTLLQTVTPDQAVEGMEVNVSAAVYCNTASRVSMRIASTDGTAHGGTGWELITVAATLGATASNASAGFVASSGTQIVYFADEAMFVIGQSEPVVPYWEPILNWNWIPNVGGASNNGYIEVPYDLPSHHVLRIVSRDMISSVSADTDTLELDGELLEPMYDMVRAELCQEAASVGIYDEKERAFWFGQAAFYRNRGADYIQRRKVSLPNPRIKIPDWSGVRRRKIAT